MASQLTGPTFQDRVHAGHCLAQELRHFAHRPGLLILGLPRGGVPVAAAIAQGLHAPLDVLLVRKLGVPGHPELALGAIASDGTRVLNLDIVADCRISEADLEAVTAREWRELMRRDRLYRPGQPAYHFQGRSLIVVDDGMATGATMKAALQAIAPHHPAQVAVAVPVGPPDVCEALQTLADTVVCLVKPTPFQAVGQWYARFNQTSDAEVCRLLQPYQ